LGLATDQLVFRSLGLTKMFEHLPEGKVKLISGDGFEFIVDEEAARVSSTLRGMLDSEGEPFSAFDCCLSSHFILMLDLPATC
jgi:predicted nucleic acid-binding protein